VQEEELSKAELPPRIELLVLWQPDDLDGELEDGQPKKAQPIIVDLHLFIFLK
jgi:hypothetical protein